MITVQEVEARVCEEYRCFSPMEYKVQVGSTTMHLCQGHTRNLRDRLNQCLEKEEWEGTIKNVVALPIALCDDCARRLTKELEIG